MRRKKQKSHKATQRQAYSRNKRRNFKRFLRWICDLFNKSPEPVDLAKEYPNGWE